MPSTGWTIEHWLSGLTRAYFYNLFEEAYKSIKNARIYQNDIPLAYLRIFSYIQMKEDKCSHCLNPTVWKPSLVMKNPKIKGSLPSTWSLLRNGRDNNNCDNNNWDNKKNWGDRRNNNSRANFSSSQLQTRQVAIEESNKNQDDDSDTESDNS